jgi:uncharacterized protein YjbI with pentapeptide repeats
LNGYNDIFTNPVYGDENNITIDGVRELIQRGPSVWNHWRSNCKTQSFVDFNMPGEAFDYSGFNFPAGIIFRGWNFNDPIKFNGAIFEGDVTFQCTFLKGADFSNTEFRGKANFKGSLWGARAEVFFNAVNFWDAADFSAVNWDYYKERLLAGYRLEDRFHPMQYYYDNDIASNILPNLDFSDAKFHKSCIFNNREFKGSVIFHNTIFFQVPEFINVKLNPKIDMHTAVFPAVGQKNGADLYRVLKNCFAEQKNTRQELRFFRREMREEIHVSSKGHSRWLRAYQISSDYGFSVCRPLIGLLALYVISLAVSLFLAQINGLAINASFSSNRSYVEFVDWGMTFKYIGFSIGNALPFFSGGKFDSNLLCELFGTGAVPEIVKLIALVQQCLSLVFWFLIGLAIRNKFKLK